MRKAFAIARATRPRYPAPERARSCINRRSCWLPANAEIAELITAGSGLCLKDTIYEGRPRL